MDFYRIFAKFSTGYLQKNAQLPFGLIALVIYGTIRL